MDDGIDEDMVDAERIKQEPLDASYFEDKIEVARQILQREFTREVEDRENQVVHIQQQIQTVQRCLELLRYVASCEYYGVKQEPGLSDTDLPSIPIALHPCVQKLLPPQSNQSPPTPTPDAVLPPTTPSRPVSECETASSASSFPPVRYDVSQHGTGRAKKKEVVVERGSYKVSHQLVIGNVSRSISGGGQQPGQPTHSWMMYIRHRHDADLSTLISKVRYFLHESYKPDDIIDVKSSPFHLTRRGWGEFPVRLTIYFHHPADRPVDVVHHLKLDRTLSGTHMLGHETHIQVYLHEDSVDEEVPSPPDPTKATLAEHQEVEKPRGKAEKMVEVIAKEHDYCREGVGTALSAGTATAWGTGTNISPHRDTTEPTILNQWLPNRGPLRDWHKSQVLQAARHVAFPNTEACVRWLLRRWPIITPFASNDLYTTVHPYTFPSYKDYYAANIGRQRASEWYLAWKIQSVLQALNLACWSVKQIVAYCRMHNYVPYVGSRSYATATLYTQLSTFSSIIGMKSNLRQLPICEAEHEEVDIEGDSSAPEPHQVTPKKCVLVKRVFGLIDVVEATSTAIGVHLGHEEVMDGVQSNVSAAVLASALKLFLDELLRRSNCAAWVRCERRCPSEIQVADVVSALLDTPQFHILTNAGLGASSQPL